MAGVAPNEYRFVIIGKTGAGKSATANLLIGQDAFKSSPWANSVTTDCKKVEGSQNGRQVVVVDTPGLFDTKLTQEKVTEEIMKCVGISAPGPHAVILVIRIGRITEEEIETVDHIIERFGEPVKKHLIILFTRVDDLKSHDATIDDFVKNVPPKLAKVLEECGGYVGVNNNAKGREKRKHLNDFFALVDEIVKKNNGMYYTNETYKEVEEALQKRINLREKQLQAEMRNELEQMKEEFRKQFEKTEKENIELRVRTEMMQRHQTEIDEIRHHFDAKIDAIELRRKEREDIENGKSGIWKKLKKGVSGVASKLRGLVM